MKNRYIQLFLCLLLDGVGYLSYAVFGLGEIIDVFWAPLAGYLNYALFKDKIGITGGMLTLLEEALPGTDFVPSFTITWVYVHFIMKKRN